MDLKGITWVGHVYQKFEAMCLEVEDIIYQDTVKYVENQVHTVGSSVKKFYSDVMEDFLPPSSMDLVKGKVVSNLPAEKNADVVGICKKPKVSIKEEAMKVVNEQLGADSLATADLDKGAGHGQSFHGFHIEDTSFQASSGDTIKGAACSDVYSMEYDVTADLDKGACHGQSFHGFHIEDTSFQASSGDTVEGTACSDMYSKEYDVSADLDKGAGHGQSFHGFHIEDTSFQASSGDTIKGAARSDVYSKEYDVAADLDKGAGHGRSFHGFHIEDTSFQASSGDTIKGAACSDVYSKEYNVRFGHNQSSLCMQKISKEENLPPSEMSGEIPHMERDLSSRGSSSCELVDKNQEASDDQVAANLTSVTTQMASHKSIEENNDDLDNASKGASGVLTSSPSAKQCDEIENSSVHSSCSSLSAELNDIRTSDGVVSLVGSFVNEDGQPSEFPDKITFVCHPGLSDYSTMDTLESSTVVDQGFETIQQVDNIQIEETCVLVNGDELCFLTHKESKPRPYKKKIQDAISSRMRLARKHEYKQVAEWYDEDVRSKQENAETKGSPSHGSCELEWELL